MIASTLARLLDPRPLDEAEARTVFDRLVAPDAPEVHRAALLTALAARPLDAGELAAFATAMRERATPFPIPERDAPIDLCGSGGAPTPSFNVSTVSAFVVAACDVPVVKHGNRSASGVCGSSDLLEALGLPVTRSRGFAQATYRARRIAFLHAPMYHPAAKAVADVRRQLGIPTIFNRLGPLANPARVPFHVVGAPSAVVARAFAEVLPRLGVRRGLALSSADGCDEFSPVASTVAYVWDRGGPQARVVRPEPLLAPEEREGPWGPLPPPAAAREAERLLAGEGGARRGSVLLTSGAALWLSGHAERLRDGVVAARKALDGGEPLALLEELRSLAAEPRGTDR